MCFELKDDAKPAEGYWISPHGLPQMHDIPKKQRNIFKTIISHNKEART